MKYAYRTWLRFLVRAGMAAALAGCGNRHINNVQRSPDPQRAQIPRPNTIFRDVASEAGIKFQWGHGGRSPLTIIETLGHGCAFIDYNRDGLPDVLLVGNRHLALFHNAGHGKFREVTAAAGFSVEATLCGVAVGDYDNDGYPDIFITGYGRCFLFHNRSGSRFEDVTSAAGVGASGPYDNATAATFVDLDGDGRLDLFVGRYIQFSPSSIQYCTYHGIRAGCGVKNYDPAVCRVYQNEGDGRFTDKTKTWGFSALSGRCLGVVARTDETSAIPVLYCANDELAGNLMVKGTDGRFHDLGVSSATAYNREGLTQGGMGADWGDIDNDGRLDLVVATFQNEPKSLYRNEGYSLFSEVGGFWGVSAVTTSYVAWTVKLVDVDNDGWLDLFITNGHSQDNVAQIEPGRSYAQPMQLFLNDAGRQFRLAEREAGETFQRPIVGRGAAFGDYDNDGRIDVVVVDEEGKPLLLHNENPTRNHWLGIKLIGTSSNRDAVGARVELRARGRRLVREVQAGGGYLSSHDPRILFGIGSADRVDSLTVRWPSGRMQTVRSDAIDKYIAITEDASAEGSRHANAMGK